MPVFRSKKLITERHADPVTMDHIIALRKEIEDLKKRNAMLEMMATRAFAAVLKEGIQNAIFYPLVKE